MEDDFIAAILNAPNDEIPRLLYADWLEERGDPRAEFLRIEAEILRMPQDDNRSVPLLARLKELHQTIDSDWLALVKRLSLDPLSELRAILPPPKRPYRASGNWEALEKQLGLRLPGDYKAFISTYGGGTVGCLDFPSLFDPRVNIRQLLGDWASFYRDVAEYVEVPYPIFPEPGGLLPFGSLGDVDFLNWLTVGQPDQWPFVYYNREEGFFQIKGLTAVEFVLEALTKRSPLLRKLRKVSAFDKPLEFEPHMETPRSISLVHQRKIDIDQVMKRLASRWPSDQVRIRLNPVNATLLIEPLAGSIHLTGDTGDERTLASVLYDESYATGVEQAVSDLLSEGFVEMSRS